ncbi:glycosyltransferase [Flavobacterium sp. NST-5]|uniref:Glycosyltransferase n=1 Tax=Flavobacterium ichthyis TaxID=2698827 RepID=A0ABW9Z8V3_9FLAO|nr:glycosyltransferase [Flavobacterium ichthyis]NBL65331.1 glycosyltransferase [Flavobacterium ichthyis]
MGKTKICLIGINFSNGGADKIHAVMSNYFFSQGFEVHNVIFNDLITYEFSGKLINLGKIEAGSFRKFFILKKFISDNNFDFIVDFRNRNNQWKEFLITKFLYTKPYIITVHSYQTSWYFPENKWLSQNIFKKAYAIVTVSKLIEAKVREKYGYQNVTTIYNMLETQAIERKLQQHFEVDFKYILAVGRMVLDNNKQFNLLIESYAKSMLPQKNIKLLFLGDGPQKPALISLAKQLNVEDQIVFEGFVDNPFIYMKNATFTTLTSKNEGLPNIIMESLACGTPVISFDCKSGPSELIFNEENGLLVEDQNFKKLVEAMNRMIDDEKLHEKCKANAKSSVARFSPEIIGKQWISLLQSKP